MINKQILLLLFASLVLSFAPLFAKIIALDAGVITWWRCLIAGIILGGFLAGKSQIELPKRFLMWMALSGTLMGLHWWLFFVSIQASSVSIGVLTLFTFPLFTALLEPVTQKVPVSFRQILGATGILAGVYFLVPDFSIDNSITMGVLIGLLSAFSYAIRNIVTKNHLSDVRTMTTLFYQMLFAFLAVSTVLVASFEPFVLPAKNDLILVAILALVCTVGGHGLMTHCLKLFSAATVGIVGSLQVVLSSLLALIILSEIPTSQFYYGAVVIVSIAIYELLPRKEGSRSKNS